MVRLRTEDVVAERAMAAICCPGWVVSERLETGQAALCLSASLDLSGCSAYIVKIDVYPAIMAHQEISKRINLLDGILEMLVGGEKPGILFCNEVFRCFSSPQLEGRQLGSKRKSNDLCLPTWCSQPSFMSRHVCRVDFQSSGSVSSSGCVQLWKIW